jgi:hypothetical protein
MINKKLLDNNTQMGLLIAFVPIAINYFFTPIQISFCVFFAIFFVLIAIAKPILLSPITRAWLAVGGLLGKIFSSVFLFLFYYTLITGLSVIYRLLPEGRMAYLSLSKIQTTWHTQKHYDDDLERQS